MLRVSEFAAGVSGLVALVVFSAAAALRTGSLPGSTFIALNPAFMQATGSVLRLSSVAVLFAQAVPPYPTAKPILQGGREAGCMATLRAGDPTLWLNLTASRHATILRAGDRAGGI
jgi:hypothetical protein